MIKLYVGSVLHPEPSRHLCLRKTVSVSDRKKLVAKIAFENPGVNAPHNKLTLPFIELHKSVAKREMCAP